MTVDYNWARPRQSTAFQRPYGEIPEGGNADEVARRSVSVPILYGPVLPNQRPASMEFDWTIAPTYKDIGHGLMGYDARRRRAGQRLAGDAQPWTGTLAKELADLDRAGNGSGDRARELRSIRAIYYGQKSREWYERIPLWAQITIVAIGGMVILRATSGFSR